MAEEQPSIIGARIAQEARSIFAPEIRERSGRVLYSPAQTLLKNASEIYFLGIYPGFAKNDPQVHNNLTIEQDLLRLEQNEIKEHALLDECWDGGDELGKLQRRARKVFAILAGSESAGERLLRDTPASNMILLRKKHENEALLKPLSNPLLESFWRFHRTIIATKQPKLVLTYAVIYARRLAKILKLGEGKRRDSGHPVALPYLYAWQLREGPMLLAIPNLGRYDPGGAREQPLKRFFDEFVPKGMR